MAVKRSVAFCSVVLLIVVVTDTARAANPPGLMFSTVLNGVQLDPRRGDFRLDRIQATFLPTPSAKSNSIYPYTPDEGGKLWAVLSNTEGGEVARYDFYAESLKPPFWLLNSYKLTVTKTGEQPASGRMHLDKGKYALDFFVEGERFYHMPFQVDVLASDSSFNPEDYYFLDGEWDDWGYFYYREANPEQSLQWKIWLRNKRPESNKQAKIEVEVRRGDTLICTSRPNTSHSLRPSWTRTEFDLVFPMEGTSGGAYFKAKDLVNTAGSYTLNMKINGEPYGQWKFEIADGKFLPTGRTLRGETDPLAFVEGGVDAFWYARE